MKPAMFKYFLCSPIDVPVDAGGDGVDVTESAKPLRIDTRAGVAIVGLAGGLGLRSGLRVGLAGADVMLAAAILDPEFIDTRVSLEDALRCC